MSNFVKLSLFGLKHSCSYSSWFMKVFAFLPFYDCQVWFSSLFPTFIARPVSSLPLTVSESRFSDWVGLKSLALRSNFRVCLDNRRVWCHRSCHYKILRLWSTNRLTFKDVLRKNYPSLCWFQVPVLSQQTFWVVLNPQACKKANQCWFISGQSFWIKAFWVQPLEHQFGVSICRVKLLQALVPYKHLMLIQLSFSHLHQNDYLSLYSFRFLSFSSSLMSSARGFYPHVPKNITLIDYGN